MAATVTSALWGHWGYEDKIKSGFGHGRTNAENAYDFMWEADERRMIQEVTDTFIQHEGQGPKGWMGAGAYENSTTPDLLKEAGYTYLMDWPCDDQPI